MLFATDFVIIPIVCIDDAIDGAEATIDLMDECRQLNADLRLLGILMNQACERSISFQTTAPLCEERFGTYMFHTLLPRSQDAALAENASAPVTTKCPNGKLAQKYAQLVAEIADRIQRSAENPQLAG